MHHLIDSLKDGEWWVRIRVIEALEQLGEGAVEPLYLALEDSDVEVRSRAAMTLERLGDLDKLLHRAGEGDVAAREKLLIAGQAGVVEILIDALSAESPRVRYAVTEILGEVSHDAVTAALIQRLTEEQAAPIRAEVVRALANLRDATAAEPISHLLGDHNETIRVEAVRALERIQVANPNALLSSALGDPEPRVRAGAAVVLGKVGDELSVAALLPLLADCDETVRAEAARALGLLRATQAVPRLMDAFHDYNVDVQVAAARALGQVGSPDCLEALVRGLENASPESGWTKLRPSPCAMARADWPKTTAMKASLSRNRLTLR
jgi:HEAT repeat protein